MAEGGILDLDFFSKTSIIIGSGVVLCGIAAFIYKTSYPQSNSSMTEVGATSESPVPNADVGGSGEKKVLVLGLDGAGKSSLLLALSKNDNDTAPTPTAGFNVISVQTDGTALNIWEIGGNENTRKYWSNFYTESDVFVYVVDSAASDRMTEARSELHSVMQDEYIRELPLIVVANKQDSPEAKSPEEISEVLDLINLPVQYQIVCTQVPINEASVGIEELEKILTGTENPV